MNEFCPRFSFKRFAVDDRECAMKVGTDGVLLGAWAFEDERFKDRPCTIADVGAGSGVISLMLAQRFGSSMVTALEVDAPACSDLRKNIANSPFSERIKAVEGDFSDFSGRYDLIVCNPPFFANGEQAPQAERALARHAGTLSPESMVKGARRLLDEDGLLAMVTPLEYDGSLEFEAALARMSVRRKALVATSARRGVTRILWEFSTRPTPRLADETITVGDDRYRTLTSPFYLNI